jgi:glycosyltransferase involved in cell wall biosynthesis
MPETAHARPVRVLELRSVRGTGGGPEKTIFTGAAQAAPDIAVTVCYLRDARDDVFSIDRRAAALGVDYVEVRERHSFDPSIWAQLTTLVRSRGIDVVHAHDYKVNLLAWLLARGTGVVPMSTAHGYTGNSRRELWLYYPADKRVLARLPVVVAVSSGVRDALVAGGCRPDRVRVLLNGIDPTAFRRDPARRASARAKYHLGEDDVVVGAVGRLELQKRFDLLIQAFAALRERHSNLRLLVAGDGSLRQELESLLTGQHLGSVCRLAGQVDDMVEFHHALDLLVQSSEYEGTPNVVLEAMAMETPVIATDVGGTAELMRSGVDGIIVPAGDVHALVEAMDNALSDPGAATGRAEAARRRVESELSFESRLRRLEDIYRELAAGRRV